RALVIAAPPCGRTARTTSTRARAHEARRGSVRRERRSAVDSRSATTSFTSAEESRYTTGSSARRRERASASRSAPVHRGPGGGEGRAEIQQISGAATDSAAGHQPLQVPGLTSGNEERHRPAARGDLDGLARLDPAKHLAGPLSQFADADRFNVLQSSTLSWA